MFMAVEEGLLNHYQLLVVDLRGYGDAWSWPGPYSFEQRVEDLVKLIRSYTTEPVWVLGYSMGGVMAQLLARMYPDCVAGLILSCTFAYKPLTAIEQVQGLMLPRLLRLLPLASLANLLYPQAFGSENFPPAVIEWYRKTLQKTRLEVLLADAENIFRFDSRPWLKEIHKPTLVLSGTVDLIVPKHHSELLASQIPQAQLLLYHGAGHALIFTHRRPFVRDVHRFILQAARASGAPSLRTSPSPSPQSGPL